MSLSELILFSDEAYEKVRKEIVPKSDSKHFFDTLDVCRTFNKNQKPGYNVLHYLLHRMSNRIIKAQYKEHWKWNYDECRKERIGGNFKLSNLYLAYECIPFDTMPFCSGLKNHVPSLSDLFECLDVAGREHEVLAWLVKNNTEQKGILFTPLEKCEQDGKYRLGNFEDIEALVSAYNNRLYDNEKQQSRKLIIKNNYIFIENYKDDTVSIIQTIKSMTAGGIENYSNTVKHWIETQDYSDVSDEKKTALINMFAESKVSLIYGAAGTGKTTLISYVSNFFKLSAITNPSPPLFPLPQITAIFLPSKPQNFFIASAAFVPAICISSVKEKAPLSTAAFSDSRIKALGNTDINDTSQFNF